MFVAVVELVVVLAVQEHVGAAAAFAGPASTTHALLAKRTTALIAQEEFRIRVASLPNGLFVRTDARLVMLFEGGKLCQLFGLFWYQNLFRNFCAVEDLRARPTVGL